MKTRLLLCGLRRRSASGLAFPQSATPSYPPHTIAGTRAARAAADRARTRLPAPRRLAGLVRQGAEQALPGLLRDRRLLGLRDHPELLRWPGLRPRRARVHHRGPRLRRHESRLRHAATLGALALSFRGRRRSLRTRRGLPADARAGDHPVRRPRVPHGPLVPGARRQLVRRAVHALHDVHEAGALPGLRRREPRGGAAERLALRLRGGVRQVGQAAPARVST